MKKKFLTGLLVFVMCFTLAGCGNFNTNTDNETSQTTNKLQKNLTKGQVQDTAKDIETMLGLSFESLYPGFVAVEGSAQDAYESTNFILFVEGEKTDKDKLQDQYKFVDYFKSISDDGKAYNIWSWDTEWSSDVLFEGALTNTYNIKINGQAYKVQTNQSSSTRWCESAGENLYAYEFIITKK